MFPPRMFDVDRVVAITHPTHVPSRCLQVSGTCLMSDVWWISCMEVWGKDDGYSPFNIRNTISWCFVLFKDWINTLFYTEPSKSTQIYSRVKRDATSYVTTCLFRDKNSRVCKVDERLISFPKTSHQPVCDSGAVFFVWLFRWSFDNESSKARWSFKKNEWLCLEFL